MFLLLYVLVDFIKLLFVLIVVYSSMSFFMMKLNFDVCIKLKIMVKEYNLSNKCEYVLGMMVVFGMVVELGILLTYRGVVNSVSFFMGYLKNGGMDFLFVVENVVDFDFILVVYMGLLIFLFFVLKLMYYGLLKDMLVVVVERGMIF